MTQELRKLAEAAPRFKEWYVLPAREPIDGTHSHCIAMEGYGVLGYWKGHKSAHTDADWLLKKEDAEFIAAANPAAILALLAERDQLQSKLGDAIRSLANWQHQFTEAQAENERLAHANNALKLAVSGLQAKLDAMGKGEPVQYQYRDARDDGTWSAWVGCDKPLHPNTWRQVRELYAEPKALAPLTDEQIYNVFAATVEDAEPFAELVGDPIWAEVVEITRAIEAAHGIHAKGGQHEDAN